MKKTTKLTVLLILSLLVIQVNAQDFNQDGSMKLTEISNDASYGYEPNHKTSIKVGKIENQRAFLKALRGPNGEKVEFKRIASCCEFKSKSAIMGKGLLDKYEVTYDGLQQPIILYLNGYDYDTPKCPAGFTFVK